MSFRDLFKERIKVKIGIEIDPHICEVSKKQVVIPEGNKYLKIKDEMAAFYAAVCKHPELLEEMDKKRLISNLYNLKSLHQDIESYREFERKMMVLSSDELIKEIKKEEKKLENLNTMELLKDKIYKKLMKALSEKMKYERAVPMISYSEWEKFCKRKEPEYLLKLNQMEPQELVDAISCDFLIF